MLAAGFLAGSASAQTNATAPIRQLSLQECVQLALKNNFNLQIDRYNPEISLYNLKASYGSYDPTLSLSGQHDHNESGNQLLGGSFSVPGSVTDQNSFSATINGLLPWGTLYNIGTGRPLSDTYGDTPTFAPDLNQPFLTTNGYVFANNQATLPVVSTNFAQVPVRRSFENSAGSVAIGVTQPLLKNFLMDSTRLNIQVAKNRLKYTEVSLRQQMMQTVTTLEQAYFDLIYNLESVEVRQKAVELAERLVMENRKRLEVGALAPLDLQSAEAQAASTRAALILAKSQLATQERLVKSLITDDYLAQWADFVLRPAEKLTAVPPVVNLQDSWAKGLSQRPEIQQAKLDVERAGIQLKYDKNQLLPQLDVFATFGYNGSGSEFSDVLDNIKRTDLPYYSYGGQFSIPLSNRRARNNYKADKASMQQLVLSVKQLEQATLILIDNDISTIRSDYDQVQATRAAREYQEAALEAEQKKLESGKSTTYTVLQVQRDLTQSRANEIQALDNYNKSLSQLSLHEGSTLDRFGITLEVK
jgi:outer membrane protein TolC